MRILGFKIDRDGRHLDDDKSVSLRRWSTPTNLHEVRSFLSFCSVYRIFVKNFATIAKPLYDLTRKNAVWEWTSARETAFQELRWTLIDSPALVRPDYENLSERPFIVTTDASPTGIGACLAQEQASGERRPIRWESKALNEREAKYQQIKREMLALVHIFKKWRQYLAGTRFLLEVDPAALPYLVSAVRQPEATMERWNAFIRTFDFRASRISGKENKVADGLSRSLPLSDSEEGVADFLEEDDMDDCEVDERVRIATLRIEGACRKEFHHVDGK